MLSTYHLCVYKHLFLVVLACMDIFMGIFACFMEWLFLNSRWDIFYLLSPWWMWYVWSLHCMLCQKWRNTDAQSINNMIITMATHVLATQGARASALFDRNNLRSAKASMIHTKISHTRRTVKSLIKDAPIPTLKRFSYCLAAVFVESLKARC